jgi:hypothetical protein
MRTIKVYMYDELSEEAKKNAILSLSEITKEHEWDDAQRWAIDDCSLFEPAHEEMAAILGNDYYDRNLTTDGKYGQFVFKNNRTGIRFNVEEGFLSISEALEITNPTMFMKWLSIPEVLHQYVTYEIKNFARGSRTALYLEHVLSSDDPRAMALDSLFPQATKKFKDHLDDILQRIANGTEAYFDDDNMLSRIEEHEYEFYEDGRLVYL